MKPLFLAVFYFYIKNCFVFTFFNVFLKHQTNKSLWKMNNKIKVTRNHIRQTEYFNKLSKVQQLIIMNSNNVKRIVHGVEVAQNIGFEEWENQSQYSWNNVQIIKEILS